MSEEKSPQSMTFKNSKISDSQLAQGHNVTQTQQINQVNAEKQLTEDDVIQLIEQIKLLFQDSDLAETQKIKAIAHLETAQEEVTEDESNKNSIAKNLQRATKVLKNANDNAYIIEY